MLFRSDHGKGKGVAGRQRARDIFLDPPEPPSVPEAHLGHRRLDDDPGVEPVLRREPRVRNTPATLPVGGKAAKTIIAFERIAAVAHETEQAGKDSGVDPAIGRRSEEHTSELQSLMRISYAVFCLKKKTIQKQQT